MRSLFAFAVVAALVSGVATARAEKQIFILSNNPDAYGIDQCLASGARCGTAMATALCRQRDFKQVVSFRKVDRDDITGAVPKSSNACHGAACDDFVAIECAR